MINWLKAYATACAAQLIALRHAEREARYAIEPRSVFKFLAICGAIVVGCFIGLVLIGKTIRHVDPTLYASLGKKKETTKVVKYPKTMAGFQRCRDDMYAVTSNPLLRSAFEQNCWNEAFNR